MYLKNTIFRLVLEYFPSTFLPLLRSFSPPLTVTETRCHESSSTALFKSCFWIFQNRRTHGVHPHGIPTPFGLREFFRPDTKAKNVSSYRRRTTDVRYDFSCGFFSRTNYYDDLRPSYNTVTVWWINRYFPSSLGVSALEVTDWDEIEK